MPAFSMYSVYTHCMHDSLENMQWPERCIQVLHIVAVCISGLLHFKAYIFSHIKGLNPALVYYRKFVSDDVHYFPGWHVAVYYGETECRG